MQSSKFALCPHLSLAARKHLVPCSKARRPAVDDDFEFTGITGHVATRLTARHQLPKPRGKHQLCTSGDIAAIEIPQHCSDLRQISGPGFAQRRVDNRPALDELELDILAGSALFFKFVAPAFEPINPGFDRVTPESELIEADAANPAIVVE